jgi:nicotinate-nucleotide adenylyltransferase
MATIGILGGTFDPPHNGHLLLAESARVQFGLGRLLFMPAGEPYRKAGRAVSSIEDRLAMARLATQDNACFEVDEREARRDGPTFTAETLEALLADGVERPVLVLGADALRDMPNWRRPARIIELARIVIAAKGSDDAAITVAAELAGMDEAPPLVDMPNLAISSTMVRERVATARPIRYLVPQSVEYYIRDHGLYGPRPQSETG